MNRHLARLLGRPDVTFDSVDALGDRPETLSEDSDRQCQFSETQLLRELGDELQSALGEVEVSVAQVFEQLHASGALARALGDAVGPVAPGGCDVSGDALGIHVDPSSSSVCETSEGTSVAGPEGPATPSQTTDGFPPVADGAEEEASRTHRPSSASSSGPRRFVRLDTTFELLGFERISEVVVDVDRIVAITSEPPAGSTIHFRRGGSIAVAARLDDVIAALGIEVRP